MKHLELAVIGKLLSSEEEVAESCRHFVEVCPTCRERFEQVDALMKRFRHWDAETLVAEAPAAEELLDALLDKGQGAADWASVLSDEAESQTWCVAWVALERAQGLLAQDATRAQARNLARLAAAIAGNLGDAYDPDSLADLKAFAYAIAAAAGLPGGDDMLREVAAAVTALDEGTGDPTVANDVKGLLARVFRKAAV